MGKKYAANKTFKIRYIYKPKPIKFFIRSVGKDIKIIYKYSKYYYTPYNLKIHKKKEKAYYHFNNIQESENLLNILINVTIKAVQMEIERKKREQIFKIEKIIKSGKRLENNNKNNYASNNIIFDLLFMYINKLKEIFYKYKSIKDFYD